MTSTVESLAAEITVLGEEEQQALWEHVAVQNYRRGLKALSDRYRRRLKRQGELNQSAEEILAKLREIREEIAVHDYPA